MNEILYKISYEAENAPQKKMHSRCTECLAYGPTIVANVISSCIISISCCFTIKCALFCFNLNLCDDYCVPIDFIPISLIFFLILKLISIVNLFIDLNYIYF